MVRSLFFCCSKPLVSMRFKCVLWELVSEEIVVEPKWYLRSALDYCTRTVRIDPVPLGQNPGRNKSTQFIKVP